MVFGEIMTFSLINSFIMLYIFVYYFTSNEIPHLICTVTQVSLALSVICIADVIQKSLDN